jgi:hypothetical protein
LCILAHSCFIIKLLSLSHCQAGSQKVIAEDGADSGILLERKFTAKDTILFTGLGLLS